MAHHDPRLLFSVKGIKAYHIQGGEEADLTPSGPQTLSLLMVPTESPFNDGHGHSGSEEDFYLHLNLPPELDLSLPATTQVYHQPPRSYLIPRWDLGTDSGAFTRIEFPSLGRGVTQEDIDTFETILAQCTAFLERAAPPKKGASGGYNPNDYQPGEAYVKGTAVGEKSSKHGQLVLVDEDDGSVVGELTDAEVVEDPRIKPGQKDPVQIEISEDGKRIQVKPLSEDYLAMARLPQYRESSIVQNAAAASRLIVTASSTIANALTSGAESFTQKTRPNSKPMVFAPTTHARVRRVNTFTAGARSMTSGTVGRISTVVENIGGTVSGRKKGTAKGDNYKPGLLNKTMIAYTTLADGLAYSGKHLLSSAGAAGTSVVGHRYGEDARKVAQELAHGVTNVGLVYIDVTGVSRRAVISSVAKGMIVGRVDGGGEVVVGAGDGSAPLEVHQGPSGSGALNSSRPASYAVYTPGLGGNGNGSSSRGNGNGGGSGGPPPTYTPGDYKPSSGFGEKYS